MKDLRETKRLSQSDMAGVLHINQATYSRYESGDREIPIRVLIQLSFHFGVSVDYLLGLTNTKEPYPRVKNILQQ